MVPLTTISYVSKLLMTTEPGGEVASSNVADAPLVCNPPIEIVELDGQWVVEEYRTGRRDGETFSTHETQMEAMRAGKTKMDDDTHPCVLRWESPSIVGGLYWNPLFEVLAVRFDDMLGQWVVVPDEGHVLFESATEKMAACRYARQVQQTYDFRTLRIYAASGEAQEEIDHRFVRTDLSEAGVRFDRDKLSASKQSDVLSDDDPTDSDESDQPAASTPASALTAAVPDITAVDVISTTGPVHQYRATWTDDEQARIATVAPEFGSDRAVVTAFTSTVEQWGEISDGAHVTSIFEAGIGPSPWVAYRVGDGDLTEIIEELSRNERLQIICDVASALQTAMQFSIPRRGIRPENVRIEKPDDTPRATLAKWGLEREVATARGTTPITPYTAPEQLEQETSPTTGIYQLGALAYRLLVGQTPFAAVDDLEAAIRDGTFDLPSSVADVPREADDVLSLAMQPNPRNRFTSPTTFGERLVAAFR